MSKKKEDPDTETTPRDNDRLAEATEAMFAFEREMVLDGVTPEYSLPQSEDEFYARDPFSADYVLFRHEQSQKRQEKRARVNVQLRADLLERPHLMEKPGEAGSRGAAAVWRSLRDLLRNQTEALIDSSSLDELMMLKRELETRKAIVEAVNTGLEHQLTRLEKRLSVYDSAETEIKPAKINIKKS